MYIKFTRLNRQSKTQNGLSRGSGDCPRPTNPVQSTIILNSMKLGEKNQNMHARIQTARICDNILLPEVISHLDQIPFHLVRAMKTMTIIFNYHFHNLHVFLCISVSFVAKHS